MNYCNNQSTQTYSHLFTRGAICSKEGTLLAVRVRLAADTSRAASGREGADCMNGLELRDSSVKGVTSSADPGLLDKGRLAARRGGVVMLLLRGDCKAGGAVACRLAL